MENSTWIASCVEQHMENSRRTARGGQHVEIDMWKAARGGQHVEIDMWKAARGGQHVEIDMWKAVEMNMWRLESRTWRPACERYMDGTARAEEPVQSSWVRHMESST